MRLSERVRPLTLGLLFSALSLPVVAQTEDAPERRLDLEEVRTLREQAESNAALGPDLQARILQLYAEAIGSLEAAAIDEAQAASFERERAGVGRMVEALRAKLSRPQKKPRLNLPESRPG